MNAKRSDALGNVVTKTMIGLVLLIGFLYLAEQGGGEDKGVQFLVGAGHDFFLAPLPFLASVADVDDSVRGTELL